MNNIEIIVIQSYLQTKSRVADMPGSLSVSGDLPGLFPEKIGV